MADICVYDGPCGPPPAANDCLQAGVCDGTEPTCVGDAWICDYASNSEYETTEALCDGVDNDCDGHTDEGYLDLGIPCCGGSGAMVCSGDGLGTECSEPCIAYWSFDGSADDDSGNEHHGTPIGTHFSADRFGNPDSAVCFSGVGAITAPRIYVPDSEDLRLSATSFTIAMWVTEDYLAPGGGHALMNKRKAQSDSGWAFSIGGASGDFDGLLGFIVSQGGNPYLVSDDPVDTGRWIHVAMTYELWMQRVTFYFDGAPIGTGTNIPTPNPAGDNALSIGSDSLDPYVYSMRGCVDDTAIYGRALSGAEINALAAPITTGPLSCQGSGAGAECKPRAQGECEAYECTWE